MRKLISEIRNIKPGICKTINKRLKEFKALGRKGNKEWFCELCFCILTANSKAKTALSIQEELKAEGFLCLPKEDLCDCIKRNKHRFHNNKAEFITKARKYKNIKTILKGEDDPRDWLVGNIKGLGWKESSHFLRNVGYTGYAILDRHILNVLEENGIIMKPRVLNSKEYKRIEKILKKIGESLKMNQAELDLYIWYIKTGEVLK